MTIHELNYIYVRIFMSHREVQVAITTAISDVEISPKVFKRLRKWVKDNF